MMRILYLTMQFGEGYFQGTERYLQRLTDGLKSRGHRVRILAGDPERRSSEQHGFKYISTGGWMAVRGPEHAEHPGPIEQELTEFQPDIVHALNPAHIGVGPLAIAQRRGFPTVITTMDFWWVCPTHTLLRHDDQICAGSRPWRECARCIARRHGNPAVRAAASLPLLGTPLVTTALTASAATKGVPGDERHAWRNRADHLGRVLRHADAVIFPAKATESIIGAAYPVLRGHRVPYGVEPAWFDVGRARRPDPITPETVRVGYAGALAHHKGVDLVLQAIAELGWVHAQILIAGDGDAEMIARLRRLSKGLDVKFLGRLDKDAMRSFLADIDLLVVPSLWPENLPIVTLEAAAAGTPVLASRVPGLSENIPESCLFEPGSGSDLARVLARWVEAGTPPPVPPVPITTDEMVERTLCVYEQTIAVRTRPAPTQPAGESDA